MKNTIRLKFDRGKFRLLLMFLLMIPVLSYSQGLREQYSETIDDPYVFVDRTTMERGPSYIENGSDIFTRQVNIDINGDDIIGDAGNEPSIAIDPTNPNRIVIGWRQFDTVTSNFRQAGNGYSVDGGLSWTFPGVLNPGVFRSDPVLDFDSSGNFYYNSLKGNFACDVYKITDGGTDWGAPFPAKGGDKLWMRIDRSGGIGAGNNYSYWSPYSGCELGSFTRSTDGSNSFEDCQVIDGNPFWGTLAVDDDGTLYMVGRTADGETVVVKSTDAQDPTTITTWDSLSVVNLDGEITAFFSINPRGLLGQGWIDVDVSGGAGDGNVYVLASVDRISNNDRGDVMFAKSIDGGATFSAPQRINTDVGTVAYQWFGTMSVAPNGRIDVAWLDTRNAPSGTDMSALYFTYSEDQGETWFPNIKLSPDFDPHIGYPRQNKMGDYFDMVSDDNYAHLAWVNTINGGQDVYYSQIAPSLLNVNDFASETVSEFKNYPNPFREETTIEFFSKNEQKVTVEVFDLLGKKVNILLDDSVLGKQRLVWNGTDTRGARLNAGIYFIRLQAQGTSKIAKVVLE